MDLGFSPGQCVRFEQDGFLLVRGLLSEEELGVLRHCAFNDWRLLEPSSIPDAQGRRHSVLVMVGREESFYGRIASLPRFVKRGVALLNDRELYLWQLVMFHKQAGDGGAVPWHQDYLFWRAKGAMLPAMVSCQLAISDSSPANGCLRVIRGSHRLGLLEHERLPWKQTTIAGSGWDKLKQLEQVDICTKAGDALFFHCQLVHCSGANTSAVPRWTLMFTYNTRANAPLADTSGHRYRPLAGVDDAWSFQQRI